jgi:predicted MFS family arabinose efflux permease
VNPAPCVVANPLTLLPQEKRLLYVLVGIQFANVVDFMIMMPLGPMLARQMGIAMNQFGVLVSAYTFAAAASGLLCALFIERFERKRLLLIVFVLFAAATLACAAAGSYEWLLFARALAGFFGGVLGAIVNTFVADNIPPTRRGQAMGMVGMAFSLSTVIGVPASLWLANHVEWLSWRAPFVALTLVALGFACAASQLLPRGAQVIQDDASQRAQLAAALGRIRACLQDRNHVTAMLVGMAVILSSFMVIPYLTIYATKNVGLPESYLAVMYFLGGLCTLFTSRAIGRWADRAGKLKVFRIMALLAMVPVLITTHLGVTPTAVYLCVSTLFFIMVNGRVVVGQALGAGAASLQARGTYMSLSACTSQLALGIASFVGGHLISTDAAGVIIGFPILGYLSVCATLLAVWLAGKVVQRA